MTISPEYIAGFFDGEGSVVIEHKNRGYKTYRLRFSIANTCLEVLKEIQAVVGGSISTSLSAIQKASNKQYPCHKLIISAGADVKRFIELIGPHIRVKRPQLEAAARYAQTLSEPGIKLTEEQRKIRHEAMLVTHAYNLNHRETVINA